MLKIFEDTRVMEYRDTSVIHSVDPNGGCRMLLQATEILNPRITVPPGAPLEALATTNTVTAETARYMQLLDALVDPALWGVTQKNTKDPKATAAARTALLSKWSNEILASERLYGAGFAASIPQRLYPAGVGTLAVGTETYRDAAAWLSENGVLLNASSVMRQDGGPANWGARGGELATNFTNFAFSTSYVKIAPLFAGMKTDKERERLPGEMGQIIRAQNFVRVQLALAIQPLVWNLRHWIKLVTWPSVAERMQRDIAPSQLQDTLAVLSEVMSLPLHPLFATLDGYVGAHTAKTPWSESTQCFASPYQHCQAENGAGGHGVVIPTAEVPFPDEGGMVRTQESDGADWAQSAIMSLLHSPEGYLVSLANTCRQLMSWRRDMNQSGALAAIETTLGFTSPSAVLPFILDGQRDGITYVDGENTAGPHTDLLQLSVQPGILPRMGDDAYQWMGQRALFTGYVFRDGLRLVGEGPNPLAGVSLPRAVAYMEGLEPATLNTYRRERFVPEAIRLTNDRYQGDPGAFTFPLTIPSLARVIAKSEQEVTTMVHDGKFNHLFTVSPGTHAVVVSPKGPSAYYSDITMRVWLTSLALPYTGSTRMLPVTKGHASPTLGLRVEMEVIRGLEEPQSLLPISTSSVLRQVGVEG